ncbi:hypothetical protein CKM354_000650100 [Cercospora kikuchii]|uniref:N-acetyltransferase domain-containing protein n=1 Tax=Cercospora kikuchii TaxID=84275 RepID=A0A9P3CFB1_9PEZI|nr:uncharacterized protein CKM354_000650100 [Cercospora kikuchii]GIZ43269.1 hypothetical protein CKM354_000650100 [Cercospora kikuchii]
MSVAISAARIVLYTGNHTGKPTQGGMAISPKSAHQFDIRLTDWNDENAVALRERLRQEIFSEYQGEPGTALSAEDIPVFVVVTHNKTLPIACGGLRPLSVAAAEVKRMYVEPEFRGRAFGVADVVLHQLETQARERGWNILRLATGVRMIQAQRFYERRGFYEIPAYGAFVGTMGSVCYEKILVADSSCGS